MTSDSPIMWVASFVLFLVFAPGLAVTFAQSRTRHDVTLLIVVPSIAALIVGGAWALLGASPGVSFYQGAVAAICTVPVLAIGLRQSHLRGMAVFTVLWSVFVFVPVSHSLFDLRNGVLATGLGTLDFGGVAVLGLCTGVASAVFAIITRRERSRSNVRGQGPRRILVSSAAIFCGFLGLALGAELIIDDASAIIVRNVVVGCALGALGWIVAQLLIAQRPSLSGVRSGMIAGAIAVLAALPWLETGAALVLAVIAGMLGALSAARLRRWGAGDWAQLGGTLFVPGVVGFAGAGVLARGVGLLYSGHADQLQAQFLGLLAVLGYAAAATTIIAVGVRLVTDRVERAAARRAEQS